MAQVKEMVIITTNVCIQQCEILFSYQATIKCNGQQHSAQTQDYKVSSTFWSKDKKSGVIWIFRPLPFDDDDDDDDLSIATLLKPDVIFCSK